ncbi:gamma-glutamyltransferase [Paenibacillus kandeliae]|uniref:gamma-glutamyltransferase n=1 Tax=Paenibacillus kandeliae TaxID=3231269 RepID=UPI003458B35A
MNIMPQSRKGMVAAPHYLASQTGAFILQSGGNAVDAAVAVSAVLGVVYPHMTGTGGDAFFLIYDQQSGTVNGYNGSGRSAASATPSRYLDKGFTSIPQRGPLAAVTVPGMVDAWEAVWKRFGKLPWEQVIAPAVRYAEEGFPASPSLARWSMRDQEWLTADEYLRETFLRDGEPLQEGEMVYQPRLAEVLREIATNGRDSFYEGALGQRLGQAAERDGSLLTADDFAAHRGEWVEPISTSYRGHEVYQMPPNTQGFSLLMMLNMLEHTDVSNIARFSPEFYHLMAETVKKAFRDRDRYLTDPGFRDIPLERLLSKSYASELWHEMQFRPQAAEHLSAAMGQDTAYAAVVDEEGNAVSFIQSLYFDFGSAYVPDGSGVILQNRGSFFSLDDRLPNVLEPRKRTFHTLMPGMVLKDGKPYLLLGTQGGEGQPQTQLSILTGVIDYGLNVQQAIALPRWLYGRTWGDLSDTLKIENRSYSDISSRLEAYGHIVEPVRDYDALMGEAQGIHIADNGVLSGAADPRSDGIAIGI